MTLQTQRLQTCDQIQALLQGSQALHPAVSSRDEARAFITAALRRFRYPSCRRAQKRLLQAYLRKVTGLSRAQLD